MGGGDDHHAAALLRGLRRESAVVSTLAFPAMRNVLNGMMGCKIVEERYGGESHDEAYYPGYIFDRAPAIGEPPKYGLECYSFAANKTVTCGHGGAVVSDDPFDERDIREIVRQGHGRSGQLNYRMANINAAIGCAQMERLEEFRAAKKRIWNAYRDVGLPMVERGSSRWMSTIRADESLVDYMREKGIECRVEPGIGVSLPCSTALSEADQKRTIDMCLSFLRGAQTEPRLSRSSRSLPSELVW
jgi:hypothetical protein